MNQYMAAYNNQTVSINPQYLRRRRPQQTKTSEGMLDPIDTQESQGTFDDGVVYQIPQSQIKTPDSHVSSRLKMQPQFLPPSP